MIKVLKLLRSFALCACLLLPAYVGCYSQSLRTDTIGFSVFFRQGRSEIDMNYRGNGSNLLSFADTITALDRDPLANVKYVYVEGAASPEGASDYNQELSERRTRSIREWLLKNTTLDIGQIRTAGIGVDWDGLATILDQTDWEYSDTIAYIIRNTPLWITRGGKVVDGRKKRLMELDGGKPWHWMLDSIYPELRQGGADVKCYVVRIPDPQVFRDTVTVTVNTRDTVYLGEPATPREALEPIFAVRTNLILPLMNVGVEVPIGNRWSVGADWYYTWAWRKWFKELDMTNCLQLLGGGLDVRYWFGDRHTPDVMNRQNRLWGHAVGAYVYGGYYDFEYDYKGYQGEFSNIGLDYMYSARLGRRHGLRMELSLGIGYIHSKAREYNVYTMGGNAFRTGVVKKINWIGPTKATISLVIPINRKVTYNHDEADL